MAQSYTAPTWTDGSGQGISASQLQALCNCMEGIVQGTDKAIHSFEIDGTIITVTYVDGSVDTFQMEGAKWIISIDKTGTAGIVDTYTITFSDGTTSTFTVTNGIPTEGDMRKATYDADETVANSGGIVAYVDSRIIGAIEGSY